MSRMKSSIRGSAAHTALQLLYEMGGRCTLDQLSTNVLSHFRNTGRLTQVVIQPLQRRGWILVNGQKVTITTAGMLWLQSLQPQVPSAPQAMRPLKYRTQPPLRDGALEYRDIPSRVGEQRAPYRVAAMSGNGGGNFE